MNEYCLARYKEKNRELAYRVYVTDMLRMLTENTASIHKEGKYMKKRFVDIVEPPKQKQQKQDEPERTAEDVVAHLKNALAGKAGG